MRQTPRNAVLCADCLTVMPTWPEASVDLIFADPPYNIGVDYDGYEDDRDASEYVSWTRRWITDATRLLKPSASLWILIGDEYAGEVRLILKDLEQQEKLLVRNWVIWHYTFGQNCRIKFNRSHAHLFYAVGPGVYPKASRAKKRGPQRARIATNNPPFTFNREAVAIPSARQTTYADRRANPPRKLPDDTWYLRPQETDPEQHLRPDGDTWYLPRLCGTFQERARWHPCQLPEALLERIIRLSSNPGELVFDPFLGSGATCRVAHRLGRDWLGLDISPRYAEAAEARVLGKPDPIPEDESAPPSRSKPGPKPRRKPEANASLYQ